jgi:hypothetical protein
MGAGLPKAPPLHPLILKYFWEVGGGANLSYSRGEGLPWRYKTIVLRCIHTWVLGTGL